jgi:hypothetical protein
MGRPVMMLMRVRVNMVRQGFDEYDQGKLMKTTETRVGE